ncbi:lipoprotein [Erwinia rhapontici]|uniref:Lipoprotein n=1 Tax=Erwinia rhapontici TaxID=55212 RepID=A0ABM7MYP3_ERWRD|nr:DUF2931 family protein [Erwinia rhapontici]BCQ34263.1 lipoprotein [Erwinia rhapontici]BCQ39092.1 lipoprotein [Erwinia rhapontici]BCQ44247.1 lipoprotein [Erwinia rhapontici]
MEIKQIAGLLSLLILTACQGAGQTNKATQNTEPKEWKFNFFTPIYLPALVTFVVVQDAAGTVYQFNTLDSTQALHDVTGEWNDSARALNGYWNHVEKPPKHMIFCWDSVIDKKVYETHLTFPWDVVDKMRKPSVYKNYLGKAAYYDSVQMGLAPEGKVAVWVNGIRFEHNYRITPSVLKTLSGDKLDICKGITSHPNGYEYYGDTPEFIKNKVYPYGVW